MGAERGEGRPDREGALSPTDELVDRVNRAMIGFDVLLGTSALLAPETTLRALGHRRSSPDAVALLRRCGPIWLTFAAAHIAAATRGDSRDWWALGWLRATEIATDAVWAGSPGFRARPDARVALRLAGAANLAMALAFGRRAARAGQPGLTRQPGTAGGSFGGS